MRALLVVALLGGVAAADPAADQLAALPKAMPACDAARKHCFGIQLHLPPAADPADGLVVTNAWIADQVAMAEKHFAAIDVGFDVVGADVLDAKSAHVANRADRDALSAATGLGGKVIHVYFTAELDDIDADGIIYGVTWHTQTDDHKYIVVSGMARPRTLAHELGHFFGLPHSKYAISIMNKTAREKPPYEDRTFAAGEFTAMKPVVARFVRDGVLVDRAKKP